MRSRRFSRTCWLPGILIVISLQGCASIMLEERSGPPMQQLETLETFPVDKPGVHITPHADGLGWLVTAEQQVEHHVRERTSQDWRGRRYVFSPLSLFAGLVQCPIGIFHLFTTNPSNNLFRFGCLRLLMLEPLDGTVALPPTVSSTVRTRTSWEALQQGVVQLVWQQPHPRIVTYALSPQGQADVRLSHALSFLVAAKEPLSLEQDQIWFIRLRYADASPFQEVLAVTSKQLRSANRVVPAPLHFEQWPAPLVLQIKIDRTTMSEEESEIIRDRVAGWALNRQICVVADHLHAPLADEHRIQYSGGVAEQQQVQLGRLLPASVVLTASMSASLEGADTVRHMALRIATVREGQVLDTAYGRSRSEVILHVLEQALIELEVVLANAPRNGCPFSHVSYSTQ